MRVLYFCLALTGIAACSPTVPDSAEGVGFNDYQSYLAERQERERALQERRRQNVQPPASAPTQAPAADAAAPRAATTAQPQTSPQAQQPQNTAQNTAQNRAQTSPQTQTSPRAQTQTRPQTKPQAQTGSRTRAPAAAPQPPQSQRQGEPARPGANNPSISDEQDFGAVSSRETIESDRERLKQQRAQYQEFQPEALPGRAAGDRPNIVEYALSTTHAPGAIQFRRTGFRPAAKNERNCAKYGSADIAQEAFLAAGGPRRDRENLDPDGDGFACGWDPRPFRNAVKR